MYQDSKEGKRSRNLLKSKRFILGRNTRFSETRAVSFLLLHLVDCHVASLFEISWEFVNLLNLHARSPWLRLCQGIPRTWIELAIPFGTGSHNFLIQLFWWGLINSISFLFLGIGPRGPMLFLGRDMLLHIVRIRISLQRNFDEKALFCCRL